MVPISRPPFRNGWVGVKARRVAALGRRGEERAGDDEVGLGNVAILPGLTNAHTHLELSFLRGRIPPADAFVEWIRGVVASRGRVGDPSAPEILAGIEEGIAEAIRCGTALVGDISNTLIPFERLKRSELAGVVFHELIRFNAPEPEAFVEQAMGRLEALGVAERVRASLAPHAPYSVAPLVFRAIRKALDRLPSLPTSVHLCESPEEMEFIASGTGAWREFLNEMGAWSPSWVPPGTSPVQYLDDYGFLDERVMAIHGVQMQLDDLARLATRGTTLVTCPRSNARTGAGSPPLEDFYASGVRVAVGTDSLASTPDLNVFAELAAMRALAPSVPASDLLDSATRQGARALGFDADYGTIDVGKTARLLAVDVPAAVADVEEYLVSGIQPEQLRWIDACSSD